MEKNSYSKNESELDPLNKEYEDYRKSLIFIRECPACHYAQGMVLLGVAFFSAVRMNFLWRSLNWKKTLGYSSLCAVFSAFGFYKISYAYHIFQIQGKVKKGN